MNFELRSEIKDRIISDNQFCLELCKILDMRQNWIIKLAKREDTHPTLILYPAVKFYMENGYKESEIFINETANTVA